MEVMLEWRRPDVTNVRACVFPSKLPQTQMEWAQLLEAQQRFHDAELQRWREIIKSSVVLLDQVLPTQRNTLLKDPPPRVCGVCWIQNVLYSRLTQTHLTLYKRTTPEVASLLAKWSIS